MNFLKTLRELYTRRGLRGRRGRSSYQRWRWTRRTKPRNRERGWGAWGQDELVWAMAEAAMKKEGDDVFVKLVFCYCHWLSKICTVIWLRWDDELCYFFVVGVVYLLRIQSNLYGWVRLMLYLFLNNVHTSKFSRYLHYFFIIGRNLCEKMHMIWVSGCWALIRQNIANFFSEKNVQVGSMLGL